MGKETPVFCLLIPGAFCVSGGAALKRWVFILLAGIVAFAVILLWRRGQWATPAPVSPLPVPSSSRAAHPLPGSPGADVIEVEADSGAGKTLAIRSGAPLRWRNIFETSVVICDDGGYFCSGVLEPGEAFTVSFPISGIFTVKAKNLQGQEVGRWEVRVR